MERIEVIEEKPMIKRLVGKFLIYMCAYGFLYLACMVFFILIAIFMDESIISIIIMSLINLAINLGFITMLSKSAICNAFEGINTVDVPNRSRRRILKIAAILMFIFIIIITIINFIAFHALFTSKIQVTNYNIQSSKSIGEVRLDTIYKHGLISNVRLIKKDNGTNTYSVFARIYSKDASITIGVMIALNVIIGILGIIYENNLLKKYLIPAKKQ